MSKLQDMARHTNWLCNFTFQEVHENKLEVCNPSEETKMLLEDYNSSVILLRQSIQQDYKVNKTFVLRGRRLASKPSKA